MSKNIAICCDGTWNTADQHNDGNACPTNVIKTARGVLAQRADGTPQVVFYVQGVGTRWGLDRLTGGAFGVGLSTNVQEAYRFIVHNLEAGDRLYVFGFSRGAYTARSLCGLIRKAGVLSKHHSDLVPAAYKLYKQRNLHPDDPPAVRFREQHSRETSIHFLGVWDTVGALGIPARGLRVLTARRHQFHDVQLSKIVRNAFHALAIDEQRRAFRPTLWSGKTSPGQRVEQVWFAGAHSNVGGGYPEPGLADEAFLWMVERAEECGLAFDPRYLQERVRANPMSTLRDSHVGLYRLGRRYLRPMGEASPQDEALHSSALHRYSTEAAAYRPRNLGMYIASPWYRLWPPPLQPQPAAAPPSTQPVPGIIAIPTD